MSRWSSSRAQTEPIAALVAVLALSAGIGLYGLYTTNVLGETTDRTLEEPTLDQIWNSIGSGGVFPAYEYDDPDDLHTDIATESLPYGSNVYVTITTVNPDGQDELQAVTHFDSSGSHVSQSTSDGPAPEATALEKPIPVEVEPGRVRGGTLRVVVW